MNYDEMYALAAPMSDHGQKVDEFLGPLQEALRNTKSQHVALEIGTREGGSAFFTLWHLVTENKNRMLLTVDTIPCPSFLRKWVDEWKWKHLHYTLDQDTFSSTEGQNYTYGFIYHDGGHDQVSVMKNIGDLAPLMVPRAMLVIDDVDQWNEIPDLTKYGLEWVDNAFFFERAPHGYHVGFWRKK